MYSISPPSRTSQPPSQNEAAQKNVKTSRSEHLNDSIFDGYRQKYSHSCGAACLFYIARYFGLQRNPIFAETLKKFSVLLDAYPYYDSHLTLRFCYEIDVYRQTGEFKGDTTGMDSDKVSWPHSVIQTAELLGLETKVYIAPGMWTDMMRQDPALKEERQLLTTVARINDSAAPELEQGEFEMKLCIWEDPSRESMFFTSWNDVSHWIISRPDHSIMEPAVGGCFKNLAEFNSQIKLRLIETGISIVIKDSGVNPHLFDFPAGM